MVKKAAPPPLNLGAPLRAVKQTFRARRQKSKDAGLGDREEKKPLEVVKSKSQETIVEEEKPKLKATRSDPLTKATPATTQTQTPPKKEYKEQAVQTSPAEEKIVETEKSEDKPQSDDAGADADADKPGPTDIAMDPALALAAPLLACAMPQAVQHTLFGGDADAPPAEKADVEQHSESKPADSAPAPAAATAVAPPKKKVPACCANKPATAVEPRVSVDVDPSPTPDLVLGGPVMFTNVPPPASVLAAALIAASLPPADKNAVLEAADKTDEESAEAEAEVDGADPSSSTTTLVGSTAAAEDDTLLKKVTAPALALVSWVVPKSLFGTSTAEKKAPAVVTPKVVVAHQ